MGQMGHFRNIYIVQYLSIGFMGWVRVSKSLSIKVKDGGSSSGGSGGGGSSGGGSSRDKYSNMGNVEVKYYKPDGTAVYGVRNVTTTVPSGATAASGANIKGSGSGTVAETIAPTTQTGSGKYASKYVGWRYTPEAAAIFDKKTPSVGGGAAGINVTQNTTTTPNVTSSKQYYGNTISAAGDQFKSGNKRITSMTDYEIEKAKKEGRKTEAMWLERYKAHEELRKDINRNQNVTGVSGTSAHIAEQLNLGVGTAVIGTGLMLSNIPKAVKGAVYAVTHPYETGSVIKGQLESRSGYDIGGELGTYWLAGKVAGTTGKYVYEKSPIKPEFEIINLETTQGTKRAGAAFGIQIKNPKTGKITAHGFTPTLKSAPEITGVYQPKTAIGGEFLVRNIKKVVTKPSNMLIEGKTVSPRYQQEYAVKAIKAQQEVGNVKSVFTRETISKTGTERLSPSGTKAFLEYAEGKGNVKGAVRFGSGATSDQLLPITKRGVHDLDMFIPTESEASLSKYTQGALKVIKKTDKARIPKDSPFTIETFKRGKWDKAVEFKGIGIGDGDVVPDRAFGYNLDLGAETIKIDGKTVAGITIESKRKLAAAVAIRPTEGSPSSLGVTHTGRFKDVPDLFRIIKTQASSAASKGIKTPAATTFLDFANVKGIKYMDIIGTLNVPIAADTAASASGLISPSAAAISSGGGAAGLASLNAMSSSSFPSPSPIPKSPSPSPYTYVPPVPSYYISPVLPSGGGGGRRGIWRRRGIKQPKKYTPDTLSVVSKFKGRPTKGAIKTGIGRRPILKLPKPEKLKFKLMRFK